MSDLLKPAITFSPHECFFVRHIDQLEVRPSDKVSVRGMERALQAQKEALQVRTEALGQREKVLSA